MSRIFCLLYFTDLFICPINYLFMWFFPFTHKFPLSRNLLLKFRSALESVTPKITEIKFLLLLFWVFISISEQVLVTQSINKLLTSSSSWINDTIFIYDVLFVYVFFFLTYIFKFLVILFFFNLNWLIFSFKVKANLFLTKGITNLIV